MNRQHLIFIVAGILLLLVIGGAALIFLSRPSLDANEPNASPFNFFDSNPNTPLSPETPNDLEAPQDPGQAEDIVIDFRSDGITIPDPNNEGWYFVSGGTQPTETGAPYSIVYSEDDQQFTITLLKEPISETRIAAEQELMKRLSLSEDLMCRMKYWVGVPYSYNEFYAGRNLGFSFCPGAVKI